MIIVGAGSAGLYLSSVYGKNKEREITIIEEHKQLGLPVQCTGLLTEEINKFIAPEQVRKFTLNKITSAKIYSPNNSVCLKIKDNIVIDNVKFVEYLASTAEKKNSKILTNHRYISNNGREIKVKDLSANKTKMISSNILVGADGPQSSVALNNSLDKNKFLIGMQARIKIKDLEKSRLDFYPYIGEYAWSVPESDEISRVGIAAPLENKNAKKIFEDFLKKYPGQKINTQAGLIPFHNPKAKTYRIQKKFSVFLLGDSAGQIKNTTGGGIIPGLKAAAELGNSLSKNNPSAYPKNIKNLNRELYLHYIINRALNKYSCKDWDRLIKKVDDEKIKKVLENKNRDNITRLLFSLAKKPSMISEGARAISKLI